MTSLANSLGGTRGMGQAMVHQFLQEEANVSYCARTVTNTEFDEFYKMLPEGNRARAVGTAFNVASKEAIIDWVKSSAERFGKIDVIVANGNPTLSLFWLPIIPIIIFCL